MLFTDHAHTKYEICSMHNFIFNASIKRLDVSRHVDLQGTMPSVGT